MKRRNALNKEIRRQLVETGHVDVIISAGNNFFYTKSLPCSLWFFDKGKSEALRDKVLFIDARNYYTVVDRTQNEWTEQQLQNLAAIMWLYRGETDKYRTLVEQYAAKPFPRAGRVAHRAGWGGFKFMTSGENLFIFTAQVEKVPSRKFEVLRGGTLWHFLIVHSLSRFEPGNFFYRKRHL